MMSRFIAICALLLPSLVAACGHSPQTQFLTLEPTPAPGAIAGYRGPTIRLPVVHIPPALDRDEFAQQASPGEIKVDDFVRWSAPLGMLARNTLILDLAARLPAGAMSPPDAPAQSAGLRVDVSVLSLEVVNGNASLQAAYGFARDDDHSSARYQQWTTQNVSSGGNTPLEAARAYSALLGRLADRIAADLTADRAVLQGSITN